MQFNRDRDNSGPTQWGHGPITRQPRVVMAGMEKLQGVKGAKKEGPDLAWGSVGQGRLCGGENS